MFLPNTILVKNVWHSITSEGRHRLYLHTFLFLLTFSAFVPVTGQVSDTSAEMKAKPDFRIDRRIDNMGYWKKLASEGIVPRNPYKVAPPASMKGTKLVNASVATSDSPDIPVTSISSTQSENSIFLSPVDGKTLLNSNNSTPYPQSGSFLGADALVSNDEGENWGGQIEGAGGYNMGDPVAVVNTEGRMFVGFIHRTGGQGIAFSDDNGATWETRIVAARPAVNGSFLDKNHLWVDISDSSQYKNWLYAGWTVFGGIDDSHVALNRSRQRGYGWLSPVRLSDSVRARSHNQGINIATGPYGEVYAVWSVYDDFPGDEAAIGFASSFNGGKTFNPSKRIIDNIRGIRHKGTGKNMRVNSFPSMAVDLSNSPWRGTIYVVWANVNYPGVNSGNDIDVYMIKSADSGKTWSPAIKVNQDVQGSGKKHYFPWITCDPSNGNLAVVFYDDRNCGTKEVEAWVAVSTNGGLNWQDFRVSDVSFTPAPVSGLVDDYFGDYLGITSGKGMVYPCWTDNRTGVAMGYVSPFRIGPEPGSPYISYVSNRINDNEGNANGMADFGENILMSIKLRNMGDVSDSLLTIKLIPESENISMIDSTENVEIFNPNEMKELFDAFRFSISDSVLNKEDIRFKLEVRNWNDSLYKSYFTINVNAPELSVKYVQIENDDNLNGSLDPMEKAEICFIIQNTGLFTTDTAHCRLVCNSNYIDLDDTVIIVPPLSPGNTAEICFNTEVADIEVGNVAFFDFSAVFNYQSELYRFPKIIGQLTEDWESGTMRKFSWLLKGKKWWKLDSTYVFEGKYSVRSGKISDGDSTSLSLKHNVMINDSISFFYKVSSEDNFDFLNFYIDNDLVGKWSGDVEWSRAVFPVLPGKRTFTWEYQKDVAIKAGLDAAFVDLIHLPSLLLTTVDLGPDRALCTGKSYSTNPSITYYDSVYWSTDGTGFFDNPQVPKTVFHPSAEDYEHGSVNLIIKVWGKSFDHFISDTLNLTFIPNPFLRVPDDTLICFYDSLEIDRVIAQDYASVAWSGSGDGFFNDTTLLQPVYFPGRKDIDTGVVHLIVRTFSDGVSTCGFSTDTIVLNIEPHRKMNLPDEVLRCAGLGITLSIEDREGDSFLWSPINDTTPEINFDTAGLAALNFDVFARITDKFGCIYNDTVKVSFTYCDKIIRCGNVSISISPNPSNDFVNIQCYSNETTLVHVSMINAAGAAIRSGETGGFKGYKSLKMNLQGLSAGVYYLVFKADDDTVTSKLIIQ